MGVEARDTGRWEVAVQPGQHELAGGREGAGVRIAGRVVHAVVVELDAVIRDIARLHAAAWQTVLDEVLTVRAPAAPRFDPDVDYHRHVRGRPRQDGARALLAARGLRLPEGDSDDPPGTATVWQVANAKQSHFAGMGNSDMTRALAAPVALLRELRGAGAQIAVVAAIRDADVLLAGAGANGLIDALIDEGVAERLGLAAKPKAEVFREAARELGAAPDHSAVVTDAPPGVRAARRAGFALVVGVDRLDQGQEFAAAGAHVVVTDFAEPAVQAVSQAQPPASPPRWGGAHAEGSWLLRFDGYERRLEGRREALCTVGNGYLASRGAVPEARADGTHYPGTYLAGVYNRLCSEVAGRTFEHEHLVNAPNWCSLAFHTPGGEWFGPDASDLLDHSTTLDLRRALLERRLRFRDRDGRVTAVRQRRFVSLAAPHLAVLETVFTAQNWDGELVVTSVLDPDVANTNVTEEADLAHRHLRTVAAEVHGDVALLETETVTSGIRIAQATRTRVTGESASVEPVSPPASRSIGHRLRVPLTAGAPITVVKTVATVTSRDVAIAGPASTACTLLAQAGDQTALRTAHERAWLRQWQRFDTDIEVDEVIRVAVRLYTYHLLTTVSWHLEDVDAGMGARGLTGEGYHGHVFWDELFALPVLNLRQPRLARALLRYRYRRLGEARAAARAAGLPGAMFPWQSGSEGPEETPELVYNPHRARWIPNHSRLQRHVGIAIAYNVWQHYQVTADLGFLTDLGGELIIEVARFLCALARHDRADDRYHIEGVMGPDEFHDGYPEAPGRGVRDNAYTNVMTAWVLSKALEVVRTLAGHHCGELWDRLEMHEDELARWDEVSRRLAVPWHADGVMSQFDGYERLPELDWARYRTRYGDLSRLDVILDAEGDSPNRYRVAKQADTLMLAYLLSAEELRDVLKRLGYEFDAEALRRTVAFYRDRVSHGSTLSRVAHAWVLTRADRPGAWQLFREALDADLGDTQGNTHEGIHLGAMAGVLDILQRCYTGLEVREDALWLHPRLPHELPGLRLNIAYREQQVLIDIDHERVTVALRPCAAAPIDVVVEGQHQRIAAGEICRFPLRARPGEATAAPQPPGGSG